MYSIVFSKKAFQSLVSETAEKIRTETGGVFLGNIVDKTFHVIETLDPGPQAIFQIAYFEYDTKYVNHLAKKIARLYRDELKVIGLWHRHPGSLSTFSRTDDGTNLQFAKLNPDGAISLLVNIDPFFRLTSYHVSNPLRYTEIEYTVDDSILELYPPMSVENMLNYINSFEKGRGLSKTLGGIRNPCIANDLRNAINKFEKIDIESTISKEEALTFFNDEHLNFMLDAMMDDIDYLSSRGCGIKYTYSNGTITMDFESSELVLKFTSVPGRNLIVFTDMTHWYRYERNVFKNSLIWRGYA